MTRRSPFFRSVALALVFGLVPAACSDDSGATDAPGEEPSAEDAATFPDDEWTRVAPAEAGLDPAPLEELGEFLGSKATTCMAVVKDGRLVAERYWGEAGPDANQEVFSVTKSITSTLVGIAQDEGFLKIEEPASTYLTEWKGTPSESVTIANLVSNDSGRFWSQANDYGALINAPDKSAFAIGLSQQDPPGEKWVYNNAAIQTLETVLERATGQPVAEFAQERLFEPLGMTAEISTDQAGNTLTYMGLQAGCVDLARFGHLFLNGGTWDGEQIVSSAWVEDATAPAQDLQPYGYLWWLNAGDEPAWLSAPSNAYAALGLLDQVVLVLPDQDMVVVRVGGSPPGEPPGQGGLTDEMARLAIEADRAGS